MKNIVAPSILASNFLKLGEEVEMLNNSRAGWIHLDVMDGLFVPNLSFGLPVCEAIAKTAKKPLDVHLMIVKPEEYIEQFAEIGAASISVHYEACTHLHRVIEQIGKAGCQKGVGLNPHSSVHLLEDVLPELDFVNVMTVNPGFGGQRFIQGMFRKVEQLRKLADRYHPTLKIQIDGGVDNSNAEKLVALGADILVAGSYVFKSDEPAERIASLIF